MPYHSTLFPFGNPATQEAEATETWHVLNSKRDGSRTETKDALRRSILSSWALLLHSYTLQDEVSFFFSEDIPLTPNGESCEEGKSRSEAAAGPRILNFRLMQSDTTPNMTSDAIDSKENGDTTLDVNTAIFMTESRLVDSNGLSNGERVEGQKRSLFDMNGVSYTRASSDF